MGRVGMVAAAAALLGTTLATAGPGEQSADERHRQVIPRTWDEHALATLELPIANLSRARKTYASADYYYQIPVRPIYKTYPVYLPGKEPAGYKEWLRRQPPEIVFDTSRLVTADDWIQAGKLVFHSPIAYDVLVTDADLANDRWYAAVRPPVTKEGILPFIRYGIREPGKVEVGILACGTCHSRVMEDGAVADGVQGNFRYNAAIAWSYRARATPDFVRWDIRLMYSTPWQRADPLVDLYTSSVDAISRHEEAIPAGMVARNGTSPRTPTPIPSLIGVRQHQYLDHTGLVQHRTIGDLMRYAALAQGIDFVSAYGEFIPRTDGDPPRRPDPLTLEAKRYSDEQLFALANYLYSLKAPPNPNRSDSRIAAGRRVFESQGCATCHTPPLYTNNMLMPVSGFAVDPTHKSTYRIMDVHIDTDSELTLRTRRGTGYYKVPSLRGVWHRDVLGHSGYVKSLEDWFDPARLRDDYTPTGFRPIGRDRFAVTGHPYGLNLSPHERATLIAFLRSLD